MLSILKAKGRHFGSIFWVSILATFACDCASAYRISFKSDHRDSRVMMSYDHNDLPSWRQRHRCYFRFPVWCRFTIKKILNYFCTKFRQYILLLSFSENKQLPYWNSTSVFCFELFIAIGMPFCTGLSDFMQIGRSATNLWRHNPLSKMLAIPSKIYFPLTIWRRLTFIKNICVPYFH